MLATETPVTFQIGVNHGRSRPLRSPITSPTLMPSSTMDFDSALASLQEMFPDHPLEDLSFVLLNASGDVQQASENILAKTAVDPTKPKARPQVLNQFIDLFPRETPQLNSLNSNCLSLVPQVTPSVNHCGQICQATKGHKRLYRMWWPTPHFPAYNPIPTNDLQLQREQSSWATSNPDSSGSSISGTPGLTPHRHANRPEAESIAYLPDHLKQAIFSSAEIETHVGEQSSSKSHFGQDQACTAQNQIVDGFSHLNLTPQFNSPEPSWEAHADSPEATPFRQSAPLFPDHAPSHAQAELQRLKDSFPTLSDEMVANSLVTSGYATDQATTCCLNLLMMRDGVPEWDSASDPDGSSVTTDGAAEFESPMHANKSALQYRPLDDSEMLQEMHFEDKLLRLYKQFSFLPEAVIQHHLSAAQGHYDMAVALLDQMDDATHKEEADRKSREAQDFEMAQKLAAQLNVSSGHNCAHSKVQSHWSSASTSQASDEFDKQHPEMKASLKELVSKYPALPLDSLQNIFMMASGSVKVASQIIEEQGLSVSPAKPQTGPGPSRLNREAAHDAMAQWPSVSGDYTPAPPGLVHRPPQAVPYVAKNKPWHPTRRNGHSDIYMDARQAFREAQAKIHSSRQAFYNAQVAGDSAAQRHYTSQIEYWQQQANQEKRKAHKKIFSNKNAGVSNAFQVDLHALHVDEALNSLEATIKDLQRFKCTWMVEVITGKGLHSTGKDPKLLPAVKAYLRDRDFDCWETPGKVVFKIFPSGGDQDY